MKKLILGTLLGAAVAFVVGAAWWMALPWQGKSLKSVSDEDALVSVIRAQVPRSGIYVVPKKVKQGPLIFASIRLESCNPADPMMPHTMDAGGCGFAPNP